MLNQLIFKLNLRNIGFLTRPSILIGVVAITLGIPGTANPQNKNHSANRWCPVTPENIAKSEFQTDYEGGPVNFCSDKCQKEFNLQPGAYEKNLHRLKKNAKQNPINFQEINSAQEPSNSNLSSTASFITQHSKLLLMLALALSFFLLADLIKRRQEAKLPEETKGENTVAYFFAKPLLLLIMMQFSVIIHLIFFIEEESTNSSVMIYPYDETTDLVWQLLEQQRDIYREFAPRSDDKSSLSTTYDIQIREKSDKSIITKTDTAGSLSAEIRNERGESLMTNSSVTGRKLYLHWDFNTTAQSPKR